MSHVPEKVVFKEEPFLPFARPCLSPKAIEEAVVCLQSGWLATGPRVQAFEMKLQEYFEAPYALTLTSATAGLFLALKALGIKEGDEVITTAMTFVATLNTIEQVGGRPVLVDIDPHTRNLRLDLVEQAITPQTKAIIPVHFAGLPVEMDGLLALAQRHGLRVIEDAAHAMGAFYKGKKIGSFGDIQVFSFHPCKNMTTAEGGCVVTRDHSVAERLKTLRFHGIDRDAWNRYAKGGSQAYDVIEAGYKYNLSDLQATLGLYQLEELDSMNQRRRTLANTYRQQLKDIPGLFLPGQAECDPEHAWHIFTVLVDEKILGLSRHQLADRLKDYSIGTGHHYPAPHLYSFYRQKYGWSAEDFPEAKRVGDSIISLPLFPAMTEADQERVISALYTIIGCKA